MSRSRRSTFLHALSTVHTYSITVVNTLEREETFLPLFFTPRSMFRATAVQHRLFVFVYLFLLSVVGVFFLFIIYLDPWWYFKQKENLAQLSVVVSSKTQIHWVDVWTLLFLLNTESRPHVVLWVIKTWKPTLRTASYQIRAPNSAHM